MSSGPGDTLSVAADTINLPVRQEEYSIGRIIPITVITGDTGENTDLTSGLTTDYVSGMRRIDGEPRPGEMMNTDFSFVILSVSLLILTLLAVFGRKSMINGLSSISFRRHGEVTPPGTSEVFSWPPMLRNIFTILNLSLFSAISLLSTASLIPGLYGGFAGLNAVLAGVILAAILVRHLTCIALAEITGLKTLFREYMNIVYNSWFASAFILFILNVIILFAPVANPHSFIISGLFVVAITLIIRALRLLVVFTDRHISILYFILYLCALELLPTLVILKVIGVF